MEKIDNLKNILKKSVKIGVMGTILVANVIIFVGCSNSNNDKDPTYGVPEKQYGEPADKIVGNGNYVFHNFIGEKSDIDQSTVVEDVNHYLTKAETYTLDLIDRFSESLEGRPAAQAYFKDFIDAELDNSFALLGGDSNNNRQLDGALRQLNTPTTPILKDIIRYINNNRDRHLFVTCYQALDNEAFRYGLGFHRSYKTEYYEKTLNDVLSNWNGSAINNPFDIKQDINTNNCMQLTQEMDRIINQVVQKMSNGITAADLRNFINFTFNTKALAGLHEVTMGALNHKSCDAGLNNVQEMRKVAGQMYREEQALNQERTY
ncbi:MAG: hypothetical protein J6R03_00005 [Treponema sp.]|nr:hypothetical protein [Treponema sp.]